MGGRYQVEITPPADKQIRKLPGKIQGRLIPCLASLADDPRPHGSEKLAGHDGRYRIRVGDYRVVYDIIDDRLVVLVVRVKHRRDAYRGDF